jgi:hypothetical protein
MSLDEQLAITARYIKDGRGFVARQRSRIARLRLLGCCTFDAEGTLEVLVNTVASLEDFERRLSRLQARG